MAVASAMSLQLPVDVDVQRCHWYSNSMSGVPDHWPGESTFSVWPATGVVSSTVGTAVLAGG